MNLWRTLNEKLIRLARVVVVSLTLSLLSYDVLSQRFFRKTLASAGKRKQNDDDMVRNYKTDLVELSFLSGLE